MDFRFNFLHIPDVIRTSLPYFRVKLSCQLRLPYSYPKMTYSDPKVTYSYPKMTYSDPKV